MFLVIIVIIIGYAVWRYIKYTNKKWIMMNNIILARLTYEKLAEDKRVEVDHQANKVVQRSPFYGFSIDNVDVESDKWRYYSIALAEKRIPPLLDDSLAWTPSEGIRNDVEMAHSIYNFKDRLRENNYSEKHLNLMRR